MGGEEEGANEREGVRAREAVMVFEKVGKGSWMKAGPVVYGAGAERDSETNL